MQAGFQYGANSVIKKETGKNTLRTFKEHVNVKEKQRI